jgi:membrane protease subunit (stomatin/prohibitin family)
MLRRRRPVARAAVVGGVAYGAGKAGAKAGAAQATPTPPAEAPAAEEQTAPEAAVPSADDSMNELKQLKELLDSGVLTQAEFDAQKQKILQTM